MASNTLISGTSPTFQRKGDLMLKIGEDYHINDIKVTTDNKLLICNSTKMCPNVYIYDNCDTYDGEISFSSEPRCIAEIPGTKRAVVTLPEEKAIQFINLAPPSKEEKIMLGKDIHVWGIAATTEKLFVGGYKEIYILDADGSLQKTITKSTRTNLDWVKFMYVSESTNEILFAGEHEVCSIDMDGNGLYVCEKSTLSGMVPDRNGDIYIAGLWNSDIQILSTKWTILTQCLDQKDDLDFPSALTFNNNFSKLFVVNRKFLSVSVFERNC